MLVCIPSIQWEVQYSRTCLVNTLNRQCSWVLLVEENQLHKTSYLVAKGSSSLVLVGSELRIGIFSLSPVLCPVDFTDLKCILQALFHLQLPMGKNYSESLETLLPSMLQQPFFRSAASAMELPQDDSAVKKVLKAGQACLMVDVDTVIGSFFKSHHCKGTAQAEAILNSAFNIHTHLSDITYEGIFCLPLVLLIPHPKTPLSSLTLTYI